MNPPNPYQRSSPRAASPATNLQTNPSRTNNQRHSLSDRSPYLGNSPYSDRGGDEGDEMMSRGEQPSETDQRQYHKINQVIQNFFTKAALSIVSSRVTLPQSFNRNGDLKQNKWFNVILDDNDELLQSVQEWKSMDAMAGQHPSMCIEIYLDIAGLGHKQSLVIHDDDGKRWDAGAALKTSAPQSSRPSRTTQLVLERWIISVGDRNSVHPSELNEPLPNVYKKAVVLFRGLYTNLRLLPTFKYNKILAKQPANNPSLKLNYRISNGEFRSPHPETLNLPLYPSSSSEITDTLNIGSTNSPIGPLCISVEYRTNCDFTVDDSESLLSSHFMGLDDDSLFEQKARGATQGPGSLPVNKLHAQQSPDLGQAYGSLSTFHQVGPATGTSPISALRAVRDMPSSSPTESPPQKLPPNHRTAQGSKSSLRSTETPVYPRRTSVSFQPFKAGSLSSSPAPGPTILASPSGSLGRPSSSLGRTATPSSLTQPRNRTSLNALPQAALRQPSLPNDTAIASSTSSSPKPAPIARYSSSFGHRRSKFSSGGTSRLEDDNLSSGKGSATSSIQRGSETLNEGEGGSSGEVKTDDENISDFLKLLESKKDLRSFNRSDNAAREATMRKTTAQLGKYHRMKESHSALSDSVSSSMMLHRSSSSSSRQLSSVPAMIAGTSVSTASSPGKPISPHTPHTPAIPSRLSANSIIEYEPIRRSRSRTGHTTRGQEPASAEEQIEAEEGAIDIPDSPRARPWNYPRRSSSVAQQNRNLPEDEPDVFGVRSASLPAEEVDRARDLHRITSADLTSSGLFAQTELLASASRGQDSANIGAVDSRDDIARPSSSSIAAIKRGTYSSGARGRGGFFSHSSSTSLNTTGSTGATSSTERQSRYAFNSRATANDDDEPLLFQMSEIGAGGSRRSLEEARGGSSSGRRGQQWGR